MVSSRAVLLFGVSSVSRPFGRKINKLRDYNFDRLKKNCSTDVSRVNRFLSFTSDRQ